MTNGGRGDEANANMNTNNDTDMHEGSIIEHQRFGIGTVVKIEGTERIPRLRLNLRT